MDYIGNIRQAMNSATRDDIRIGERWYARMASVCKGHADRLGITPHQVGGVFAAHSINTQWGPNVRLASNVLHGRALYRGTLGANIRKAEACLTVGADPDTILTIDPKAHKVRNFARACSGDPDAVVVDRWALSVAQGWSECPNGKASAPCGNNGRHKCQRVPTGDEYLAVAAAYRKVAARRRHTPVQVQAIVWVSARRQTEA